MITGCTGGIGLEYTRQLAKIGINLVLVDKADETDLANFAKDIGKNNCNLYFLSLLLTTNFLQKKNLVY